MKILNFGSLNIDYVYGVDHFVGKEETLSSNFLSIFCGGKGLNQSIALARAGSQVFHAGAVGRDGDILLEVLKNSGVNTDFVTTVDGISGHAIIQVDQKGENCILLFGGTNQGITRKNIDDVLNNFGNDDWILVQNEICEVAYIMETAHKKGMKIILNPSPMDEKILSLPLSYVDILILNEVEAEAICKSSIDENNVKYLASKFPASSIVLTLGKKGAVYLGKEGIFRQGIFDVPVVDTTAAGDTFTGYFLTELSKDRSPTHALKIASIASSLAVSRKGAEPSIPTLFEVMSNTHQNMGIS